MRGNRHHDKANDKHHDEANRRQDEGLGVRPELNRLASFTLLWRRPQRHGPIQRGRRWHIGVEKPGQRKSQIGDQRAEGEDRGKHDKDNDESGEERIFHVIFLGGILAALPGRGSDK